MAHAAVSRSIYLTGDASAGARSFTADIEVKFRCTSVLV